MTSNPTDADPDKSTTQPSCPPNLSEDEQLQFLRTLEAQRRKELGIQPSDSPPRPSAIAQAGARLLADAPPELTPEQREERERLRIEYEARCERLEREQAHAALFSGRSRYAGCRLSTFVVESKEQREAVKRLGDYVGEMTARVADGQSVVLFGPAGTGKDHLLHHPDHKDSRSPPPPLRGATRRPADPATSPGPQTA